MTFDDENLDVNAGKKLIPILCGKKVTDCKKTNHKHLTPIHNAAALQ